MSKPLLRIVSLALSAALPNLAYAATEPAQIAQAVPTAPSYPSPPGMARPEPLPMLAHEKTPDAWPQPDYFTQALQATTLKADPRFKELAIGNPEWLTGAEAIILPTQTQAFGFSPGFSALIAAELDWLAGEIGMKAAGPTALTGAYGPFARRLEGEEIDRLAAKYPRQKIVILYLGHDGIDQAFLTLEIRSAKGQGKAHRSIALPDDPEKALSALAAALPALAKEAGLGSAPKRATARSSAKCDDAAWNFTAGDLRGNGIERACRALAVGSLMPVYQQPDVFWPGVLSPAARAWLAEAYVQASHIDSESASAIRSLSAGLIGMVKPEGLREPDLASPDAVVSRVATLAGRDQLMSKSPVRSANAVFQERLEAMTKMLPGLTRSLFGARATMSEPFGEVDWCAIETAYPEPPFASSCESAAKPDAAPARRAATNAESALYQDWRIAKYYKDIQRSGKVLGLPDQTRKLLDDLPADVGAHPFVRQLRFEIELKTRFKGDADALQAHARAIITSFVQSLADSQTNSPTIAGYSISGHTRSPNLGSASDPLSMAAELAELRMLSAMSYDRFGNRALPAVVRTRGEGAIFLSRNRWEMSMSGMIRRSAPTSQQASTPVASGVSSAPAAPSTPPAAQTREVFRPRDAIFGPKGDEELQKRIADNPEGMQARAELMIGRLKRGMPLAEAKAIVDAFPQSDRVDSRIARSHAWARPAHALYFSGEIEAAKGYYANSKAIGTGSASEMQSHIRIALVEDRLRDAQAGMVRILDRYESDYAARDLAGMLFLRNQPGQAWEIFLSRAHATENYQLWIGAYVGHRRQRTDLAQADAWLKEKKLDEVRIQYADVAPKFLRTLALIDRLPAENDIQVLESPRGKHKYVSKLHGVSARLIQSALEPGKEKAAFEWANAWLAKWGEENEAEIAPFYAWSAWIATNGVDPKLKNLRNADFDQPFDYILAKAVVLAMDGKNKEAQDYFRAARFELSVLSDGEMSDRALQANYELALIGYLLFKRTGDEYYRRETLRFVRAYQKIFPYLGWGYSIEAALDTDRVNRMRAACRAQFLDPDSYFLKISKVDVAPAKCTGMLWK